ncbi:CDP-alcohol phosphatidyltransferase family protein [Symbioplanes lichenis]|uniref:CDP-alcohol phosphatidyltransferase family protein n=1 Tax=Symbioplanes lichenis TaxID=1629072 RepID=UPI002738EC14|nr:CDP-alcohol phosphatidyltransferase family protein [Actinoplanes lichenis]
MRRVNTSLLAPLERPLLAALARVVAPRASADVCTIAGLGGAVLCCAGYALSHVTQWYALLATAGVVVHWLGDSLDGTVARLRGAARERYGFYVDHFTDTVCQVLIFVGLGLSPYVDFRVALASLVAYQGLVILVFLRTAVLGEFRLSFGGIGPTEGHALLVLQGLVITTAGPIPLGGISAYDLPVAGFGALAAFHFLRVGLREVAELRARPE